MFFGGNFPLMSFKHLRMINSASKCKITLEVIKFSKPEEKIKLRGISPLNHLRGGLIPHHPPPLWWKPFFSSNTFLIDKHLAKP
jgi:hypothetical protein